jgi:hypothetical protein
MVPTLITPEATPVEASVETSRNIERDQPIPSPVAEAASSVAEPEVAGPEVAEPFASEAQKSESRSEAEPEASEPTALPRLESDVVKNTAAAWASWRQNRDTGNGSEAADAQPKELDAPQPEPPDTAAMAVAAGAEQILQEVTAAAPGGDANNVASIVDSVLADLRPKLMEEISRKMSKKK